MENRLSAALLRSDGKVRLPAVGRPLSSLSAQSGSDLSASRAPRSRGWPGRANRGGAGPAELEALGRRGPTSRLRAGTLKSDWPF